MSTLTIEWVHLATMEGDRCDFCNKSLQMYLGLVPQVTLTAIAMASSAEPVWLGGAHSICRACQLIMGIEPGDQEVSLEVVRERHRQEGEAYALAHYPDMVGPRIEAKVYGPG